MKAPIHRECPSRRAGDVYAMYYRKADATGHIRQTKYAWVCTDCHTAWDPATVPGPESKWSWSEATILYMPPDSGSAEAYFETMMARRIKVNSPNISQSPINTVSDNVPTVFRGRNKPKNRNKSHPSVSGITTTEADRRFAQLNKNERKMRRNEERRLLTAEDNAYYARGAGLLSGIMPGFSVRQAIEAGRNIT
jgi:hypothetical protein